MVHIVHLLDVMQCRHNYALQQYSCHPLTAQLCVVITLSCLPLPLYGTGLMCALVWQLAHSLLAATWDDCGLHAAQFSLSHRYQLK